MTDRAAKVEELRRRAGELKERGVDVTQWLEDELAKAQDALELAAIDVELTTREIERSKRTNTRWFIGFVWVFVIVVMIVHALSR